ncbi:MULTISPECIES: dynamin family protein [Nitrosomonas]|uniref:Dynamin family protein n=1 Tax=Nitrosomonas communis TaxID=44574 RepID=A0A0F7K9U2_9PROT|nr:MULTISPECIES: dynamin family protein [Nitrosomonas]AKH37070.1 dynamin family protein [Nitrosomonas communis]TYP86982.1 dynamin family protein [Nitrosomonas communis]UVS62229.1 dynamin family protein [Nitrosomonas sp. PLL12]
MAQSSTNIYKRLESLEKHLAEEHPDNPVLAKAVHSFRKLDRVAQDIGLLDRNESYATHVTWWPMIAVLGTFSAGKSTFINSYLDMHLQRTGNQAVDDKFTVICYSSDNEVKTLPGIALDADPRFPFYQISRSIEEISEAGPQRIDAYIQLKTCPSEKIRGKILIDSPGFDADSQRNSTLRLTQHIIDLSDLVLVFFDARHPEPGAMKDTLAYLVSGTINRADSNKFLYILNQMDVTAKEDNPEEVVSAWQRSLAQAGLFAGKFYRIYNPEAAAPIEDPLIRERYETKREEDMAEINTRMQQIEVERSYRIAGMLEQTAETISNQIIHKLTSMLQKWKKRVILFDSIVFGTLLILSGVAFWLTDSWNLLKTFAENIMAYDTSSLIGLGVIVVVMAYIHFTIRRKVADNMAEKLPGKFGHDHTACKQYTQAFLKSTAGFRPMCFQKPAGWNGSNQNILAEVRSEANDYIQSLNDQFTNPSGRKVEVAVAAEEKPATESVTTPETRVE